MKDAFISYAREDIEFVQTLCSKLSDEERNVWVDLEGIYAGEEFWPRICAGIDESNVFLFIVTPHSVRSSFCRREVEHAVLVRKRIVPIERIEPNDSPPQAIASRHWIPCRETAQLETAVASIVDALDVDPDYVRGHTKLLQQATDWKNNRQESSFLLRGKNLREAEQWLSDATRHVEPEPSPLHTSYLVASRKGAWQRLRNMLMAVAFALVVAVGLAMFAFNQMHLADQRLTDAVGVGSHIVYELDVSLGMVAGADNIRRVLLESAAELLARLEPRANQASSTLICQSAINVAEGALKQSDGNLDEARRKYEKALGLRQQLVERFPNDEARVRDLSVCHERLGQIEIKSGKIQAARKHFDRAFGIASGLRNRYPKNQQYENDLAISYNDLGDLHLRAFNYDEARVAYEKALEIRKRLAANAETTDVEILRDLSVCYSKIGDLEQRVGNLDEAIEAFTKDHEIAEQLHNLWPDNAQWKQDLAVSYDNLGKVARDKGQYELAQRSLETSLKFRKELADAEPSNMDYWREVSVSYNLLGDLYERWGRQHDAKTAFEKDLTIAKRLYKSKPYAETQSELSTTYYRLGRLALSEENLTEARQNLEESLNLRTSLETAFPDDPRWRSAVADSYDHLGDVELLAGNHDAAKRCYGETVQRREQLVQEGATSRLWAQLLQGRISQALVFTELNEFDAARKEFNAAQDILNEFRLEDLIDDVLSQERTKLLLESLERDLF